MTFFVARDGQTREHDDRAFREKIRTGAILPTDHYWTEGMVDWLPVSEYVGASRDVINPPPPRSTQSAPAGMTVSGKGERVYYQKDHVVVTSDRFTVGATMYPIRNISSVRTMSVPADRTGAKTAFVIGSILLIIGASEGVVVLILGLVFLGVGGVAFILQKGEFAVRVSAGSGEQSAYTSESRDLVNDVTAALNAAIVEYGRPSPRV